MPRLDHFQDLSLTGKLSLGAESTLEGNIIPDTDDSRNLGSATKRFGAIYAQDWSVDTFTAGSINNTLFVDGVKYAQTNAGIQAAIDAAPVGGHVHLPTAVYTITGAITINKVISLTGSGWGETNAQGSVLQVSAGLGASTDVIAIAPTAAEQRGLYLSNFAIIPASGTPGRYGVRMDGASGGLLNVVFDHLRIDTLGSYAIESDGSGAAQGIPVIFALQNSHISGGINLANSGDTVRLIGNRITGVRGLDVSFQAGATTFVLRDNNITADAGIHIGTGATFVVIDNNEIETFATFTGSNGAVIDIDGTTGSHALETMVTFNTVQVVNGITADGLRVNYADNTYILGNRFGRGAGASNDIDITANATETFIGPNIFAAGGALTSAINDTGTTTRRFFPYGGVIYTSAQHVQLANGNYLQGVSNDSVEYSLSGVATDGTGRHFGYRGRLALDGVDGATHLYAGDAGNTVAVSLSTSATEVKRVRASKGTALAAGDFALSAGWGTTASVGSIRGTDQFHEFTITSAGTGQGASPTVTLTYKDGTWTTAPVVRVNRQEFANQPTVPFTVTTQSATTYVLTFGGTPVAAETYQVCVFVGGI